MTRSLGKHAAGRERSDTRRALVCAYVLARASYSLYCTLTVWVGWAGPRNRRGRWRARGSVRHPASGASQDDTDETVHTGGTGRTKYRVCSAPTHLVFSSVGSVMPNPTEGTVMGMTINLHRVFTSQAGACRLGPSAPALLRSLLPSRSRPPLRVWGSRAARRLV